LEQREKRACLALAFLFIFSGLAVVGKSLVDLVFNAFSSSSIDAILYLATIAFLACGILSLLKYYMYKRMQSRSWLLEAINSLVSSIFALVIVITTLIIEYEENLWRLDPAISIVFAIFLVFYGARVLYANGMCCCSDGVHDLEKGKYNVPSFQFDKNSNNAYVAIP
jgi:divalent metal cation (Fe/Co/Zn/Cd) transporter